MAGNKMSHKATNWALQQKGLKPATKLVLFYLADRHNPDYGCFPSQTTLAYDCEMSVRSVRRHLDALESAGLLSRMHRTTDSGNYTSDRYMLGFELHPADKMADGHNASKPADKMAAHHRPKCPTNPVKVNTVIEPVKETVVNILSSVCSRNFAEDFIEHRKAMKSPMTVKAAKLMAGRLSGNIIEADAMLCQSIENGWKGVFPVNNGGQYNDKRTNTPQGAERIDPAIEQIARLTGLSAT